MGMAVGGIVNLKYIPSCHQSITFPPARDHLFPLSTQHEKTKSTPSWNGVDLRLQKNGHKKTPAGVRLTQTGQGFVVVQRSSCLQCPFFRKR